MEIVKSKMYVKAHEIYSWQDNYDSDKGGLQYRYSLSSYDNGMIVKEQEVSIEFEPLEGTNEELVEFLEVKKQELKNDFASSMNHIDERIKSLLSLEVLSE